MQEILYANDILLIAKSMAELQEKFYGLKSALKCKGLNVNLMKTKAMVSKIGQVTGRPSSKKDLCGICGRKTMLMAELCEINGHEVDKRSNADVGLE